MDVVVFGACFALIAVASKQIGHSLMKTGLPLISGFLLTGIIAGPYMLDLITLEATLNLRFVDEVSLGFIAFAAGGELYLKELKTRVKSIAWITTGLVVCTFFLTGLTFFLLSGFIPFMQLMPVDAKIGVSILAGAILVARSPSSAIAIVNELRAKGSFTQTVLGVTIIMDVVVIILFAANSSIADALFSGMDFNFSFILFLIAEIGASVIIGYLVSRLILAVLLLPVQKSLKTGLILSSGYLVFVLSSQIRHMSHGILSAEVLLEPLLICMVAGFFVSNTSRVRKEFLKILYDISLTVYIAFFTLTGASLSLDVLVQTWPIAVTLFFARAIAILFGSFIGGTLAKNPLKNNAISWMAYITQAGVGLGLAKEVVVEFPEWGNPFATIIISIIVLNQIVGPPLFKYAIKMMKEDHSRAEGHVAAGSRNAVIFGSDGQAFALAMSLISQGWAVKVGVTHMNNHHEKNPNINVYQLSDLSLAQLKYTGGDHAGAIVAMLSDDENYKICEIAYEHFGTQTIIARLNDRKNFSRFQALGVLIVDPATAIVSLLDNFVQSPAAASLLMGMQKDRNIVDLRIKNPDLFGLALRDLRLPFDAVIMSVRRRGVLFVPHDYTRLEAGDLVTVVGATNSLKEIALRFDVNQEEALLQLVEKASAKELIDPLVQTEVKEIIASDRFVQRDRSVQKNKSVQKDRFDLFVENSPVMDLKQAMNKETFFDMVSHAMSDSLNMSPSRLYDMLMTREEEITTVLAPGLAVPHIIVEGEKKFSVLLARCRKGIEFSKSTPLVYAAFVLVGSKDERKFHLRALSAVAQIVLDPRFEKKWLRAKNQAALRQVVIGADRKREV
ncbi:cation:proton antiporter domain-containing protein [Desulfobacula phenolica]|uniref:Transporter, CPA2 family n=1 Tax=Desulfobacula phenolica TaxID=90732 RepID=A0A1H2IEH1_9BACT|nr:cation:proton antiporter [Desulfobacula phenolica]SDU42395.1 transporter, CPA2 family [Desulfobacula phenolica]